MGFFSALKLNVFIHCLSFAISVLLMNKCLDVLCDFCGTVLLRAFAAEKLYATHLRFLGSVIRAVIYIVDRFSKKTNSYYWLNYCL